MSGPGLEFTALHVYVRYVGEQTCWHCAHNDVFKKQCCHLGMWSVQAAFAVHITHQVLVGDEPCRGELEVVPADEQEQEEGQHEELKVPHRHQEDLKERRQNSTRRVRLTSTTAGQGTITEHRSEPAQMELPHYQLPTSLYPRTTKLEWVYPHPTSPAQHSRFSS